jgi:hypothetical protein
MFRISSLTLLAASVAALLACGGSTAVSSPASPTTAPVSAVDHLRTITAKYRLPAAAEADGYIRMDKNCISSPPGAKVTGAMGYHFLNKQIAAAPLDPERPTMLVYIPDGSGGLKLGAAEYFKPSKDQDLTVSVDRPTLFGHEFDGPMPGHFPGQPIHYDLHVWVGATNPAGDFVGFNPAVTCPPAG